MHSTSLGNSTRRCHSSRMIINSAAMGLIPARVVTQSWLDLTNSPWWSFSMVSQEPTSHVVQPQSQQHLATARFKNHPYHSIFSSSHPIPFLVAVPASSSFMVSSPMAKRKTSGCSSPDTEGWDAKSDHKNQWSVRWGWSFVKNQRKIMEINTTCIPIFYTFKYTIWWTEDETCLKRSWGAKALN